MDRPAEAREAVRAALLIAEAIVESVAEAGDDGCAESTVYLALQELGWSAEQHYALTDALVAAGRLRRENHRLYAVAASRR